MQKARLWLAFTLLFLPFFLVAEPIGENIDQTCVKGVCTAMVYQEPMFYFDKEDWHPLADLIAVDFKKGVLNFSVGDEWFSVTPNNTATVSLTRRLNVLKWSMDFTLLGNKPQISLNIKTSKPPTDLLGGFKFNKLGGEFLSGVKGNFGLGRFQQNSPTDFTLVLTVNANLGAVVSYDPETYLFSNGTGWDGFYFKNASSWFGVYASGAVQIGDNTSLGCLTWQTCELRRAILTFATNGIARGANVSSANLSFWTQKADGPELTYLFKNLTLQAVNGSNPGSASDNETHHQWFMSVGGNETWEAYPIAANTNYNWTLPTNATNDLMYVINRNYGARYQGLFSIGVKMQTEADMNNGTIVNTENITSTPKFKPKLTVVYTANTPPVITITAPLSGSLQYPQLWFNATVTDLEGNGISCLLELDRVNYTLTNSTGNWNYYATGLAGGNHYFVVYCNDSWGFMNSTYIPKNSIFYPSYDGYIRGGGISWDWTRLDTGTTILLGGGGTIPNQIDRGFTTFNISYFQFPDTALINSSKLRYYCTSLIGTRQISFKNLTGSAITSGLLNNNASNLVIYNAIGGNQTWESPQVNAQIQYNWTLGSNVTNNFVGKELVTIGWKVATSEATLALSVGANEHATESIRPALFFEWSEAIEFEVVSTSCVVSTQTLLNPVALNSTMLEATIALAILVLVFAYLFKKTSEEKDWGNRLFSIIFFGLCLWTAYELIFISLNSNNVTTIYTYNNTAMTGYMTVNSTNNPVANENVIGYLSVLNNIYFLLFLVIILGILYVAYINLVKSKSGDYHG